MWALAWVMFDGSFDEIDKKFETEKELHEFARKSKNDYVYKRIGEVFHIN